MHGGMRALTPTEPALRLRAPLTNVLYLLTLGSIPALVASIIARTTSRVHAGHDFGI